MPEDCGICGNTVPFSETVHTLVHTHDETGVVDCYICRTCYKEHLAGLFE